MTRSLAQLEFGALSGENIAEPIGNNLVDAGAVGRWLTEQAPSEIPHLPPMAHTAVGIAFVIGLMLWAFGGKVVKPAFAVLGFVAGGILGMVAAPSLGVEDAFGLEATTLAMLGGGIAGLVVSAILFRAAMTATATTSLAAVGLMAGLIAAPRLELQPPEQLAQFGFEPAAGDTETSDAQSDTPDDGPATTLWTGASRAIASDSGWPADSGSMPVPVGLAAPDASTDASTAVPADAEPAASTDASQLEAFASDASDFALQASERVRSFAGQAWNAAMRAFGELESNERFTVVVFTLGGGVLGMLLGSLFPKKAASLVTSLLGSAIAMAALAWTMLALELPGTGLLNQQTETLASAWLIVSLVGMVYQATSRSSSDD